MTHEGIIHEGKGQFSCFTDFNIMANPFMSSSWTHTVETIAIASAVCRKTIVLLLKKFGLHQISDILKRQKRQLQELHSARANNTCRHPCEDTGVSWPVRNATRYETRQRHSMQTETLKTEGQRRKVRKGIAAVVVGGIWLGWCMTASVKQGENLGRGSSGWLQGEVTERTQRALKLDRRTFWLGTYVLCIHDTLILKGRHECSNRVPFQCY